MSDLPIPKPPRWIDQLGRWCVIVLLWTLLGNELGRGVDALLWEISYDYVHPADYVRAHGVRLGGWLGTCIAAVSVWGSRPVPNLTWILKMSLVAMLLVCITALAFASAGWLSARFGLRDDGTVSLSRAAFCAELVRGSFAGALVAAAGWSIAVERHRRALSALATGSRIAQTP